LGLRTSLRAAEQGSRTAFSSYEITLSLLRKEQIRKKETFIHNLLLHTIGIFPVFQTLPILVKQVESCKTLSYRKCQRNKDARFS
jgi:hypothetical protein